MACGVSGEFRGEWLGSWHCALPAFSKGDEDKVSNVAEGFGVFVFFGAEDGSRANAINHELNACVHGIDGKDGKCDELGDWGEDGDCMYGLIGILKEVSDLSVEEGEFVGVLGVGGGFLDGTWRNVGKAEVGAAHVFGIFDGC